MRVVAGCFDECVWGLYRSGCWLCCKFHWSRTHRLCLAESSALGDTLLAADCGCLLVWLVGAWGAVFWVNSNTERPRIAPCAHFHPRTHHPHMHLQGVDGTSWSILLGPSLCAVLLSSSWPAIVCLSHVWLDCTRLVGVCSVDPPCNALCARAGLYLLVVARGPTNPSCPWSRWTRWTGLTGQHLHWVIGACTRALGLLARQESGMV